MFFRYFLVLCLIALFSGVIQVSADNEVDVDNAKTKVVAKFIASLFASVAASCLVQAADKCQDHWKNPSAAISCAKDFLKANKAKCAV